MAKTKSWLELYATAAEATSPAVGITRFASAVLLVMVFKIAAKAARINADVINEMKLLIGDDLFAGVVTMRSCQNNEKIDSSLGIFDESVKIFSVLTVTFNPVIRRVSNIPAL